MARDREREEQERERRPGARERGGEAQQGWTYGEAGERPGYGRGEWGVEEQGGWRGPGAGPGYRQTGQRVQEFQQGSAAGQIPGEYRQWRSGQRPELGERSGGPARALAGDASPSAGRRRRALPGSGELAGFRGPDADRDAAGHRRSLSGRQRGPHAGRGPKNYRRADDRIWGELCDRLMAHPEIDASDVEVEVNEGNVVLRGTVPDRRTKHRVEDVADGVLGAQEVDNQLRVRRAGTTGEGGPGGPAGGARH
jgi:hypothetical protein